MKVRFFRSASVEGSGGSDSGAAAPAAAPSEPSSDSGARQIEADIADIFAYDPFGPSSEPTPPAAAEPAPVVSAPVVEPPPMVQAAPAPDPLLEAAQALRETAAALPQAVREATVSQQPQETQPDPWSPLDDKGQPVNYRAVYEQLPDSMIQALGSENPTERKQAVAALLATSTHIAQRQAVSQAVQMMRQEFVRAIPNFVQRSIREHHEQREVFSDFYGAFPSLSHPSIRPIVQQEGVRLARQLGVQGWSPEFRQKLGEHVTNMLRGVTGPTASSMQQAPAPIMSVPSARPMAPPNSPRSPEQDMADLLI
jgi:hypothetical protein